MVKCFLIHTLCSVSTLSPGETRILYSRVFGPEDLQSAAPDGELHMEERHLLQKEKLALIARQVQSACSLWREALGRPPSEVTLGGESVALQEAETGVLRLPAGEPYLEECFVLWLGVHSLGFTMVCEPHENLLLAEGTLRSLAGHCLETLRLLGPGSEVLLKSDRIEAMLHHLLPHGQLLFLNHRFTQCLGKELAACIGK
ncbi:C20orf29-like [Scleropages formosus]|uniref:Adaptor related protein complex 5 subunit sigma 1 n=1 Tax=Scleropages formosus TaxID=113540 RepID=A0A0P7V6U0_SCLFO|nr:AP-5 complex subunit sigma-1 [Scleropages formosus]KPP77832.1 C20orf29-like [Scleropages formosus]